MNPLTMMSGSGGVVLGRCESSNCVTFGSGGVVLCQAESSNCVTSGSGGVVLCPLLCDVWQRWCCPVSV